MLLFLACAPPDSVLADVDVTEATLRDIGLFHMGALIGFEAGAATLDVVTTDGESMEVPVNLAGPRLTFPADIAAGFSYLDIPLIFALTRGESVFDDEPFSVPGTDLLGTYAGFETSAAAGVGVHYAMLTNEADVIAVIWTLDFGASASAGSLWLTVTDAD